MDKNIREKDISVVGLGKLGACYAAFCAERGFEVTGFDIDGSKVDAINRGEAPVVEPELAELIKKYGSHLTATHTIDDLITQSDITLLVVPTPSNADGTFSTSYVEDVMHMLGQALKRKDTYHLFVLVSTVLPGDSRTKILPVLEQASGKTCGVDFGYCYSPSLIALGNIINNLRNPDFLFLGAYDDVSGDILSEVFTTLYGEDDASQKIKRMSIESAEIAKISLNSYVTMKITFANMLGRICERMPNANVDDVTGAIGQDSRIGSRFFRSGLGYGGPCFPRDNFAFASMAKALGIETPLALKTHEFNNTIPGTVVAAIHDEVRDIESPIIGILSLGYKTGTPYAEESQSLVIAKELSSKYRTLAFDAHGYEDSRGRLGDVIEYLPDMKSCLEQSNVLFIGNPEKDFLQLPQLLSSGDTKIIIDPWGLFTQKDFGSRARYVPLGRR